MEKTSSFQIDKTTAAAYVMKEDGTHCKAFNALARKNLLKCHKSEVVVAQNSAEGWQTWVDALSRGRNAQVWSLGTPPAAGYSSDGVPQ